MSKLLTQNNKFDEELSFENKKENEDGDVADILEETIEELNGIISTLKKISNWKVFYLHK